MKPTDPGHELNRPAEYWPPEIRRAHLLFRRLFVGWDSAKLIHCVRRNALGSSVLKRAGAANSLASATGGLIGVPLPALENVFQTADAASLEGAARQRDGIARASGNVGHHRHVPRVDFEAPGSPLNPVLARRQGRTRRYAAPPRPCLHAGRRATFGCRNRSATTHRCSWRSRPRSSPSRAGGGS